MSNKDFRIALLNEDKMSLELLLKTYDINEYYNHLGCVSILRKNWTMSYDFIALNGFHTYVSLYMSDQTFDNPYLLLGECIPWTPLQYAAANDSALCVLYLLLNGADASLKDKCGKDAIAIAEGLGGKFHQDIKQIITRWIGSCSSWHGFNRCILEMDCCDVSYYF
jgi:hypothetical protein